MAVSSAIFIKAMMSWTWVECQYIYCPTTCSIFSGETVSGSTCDKKSGTKSTTSKQTGCNFDQVYVTNMLECQNIYRPTTYSMFSGETVSSLGVSMWDKESGTMSTTSEQKLVSTELQIKRKMCSRYLWITLPRAGLYLDRVISNLALPRYSKILWIHVIIMPCFDFSSSGSSSAKPTHIFPNLSDEGIKSIINSLPRLGRGLDVRYVVKLCHVLALPLLHVACRQVHLVSYHCNDTGSQWQHQQGRSTHSECIDNTPVHKFRRHMYF